MPRVTSNSTAAYTEPSAVGPIAQVDLSTSMAPPGASIAAGATFDTGLNYADGFKVLAAAVKMGQAGNLTITRYLDEAGDLQQGAPSTVAVTANSTAVVNVADVLPFVAFRLTLQNTGGGASAIAAFALLLNAN